jgi:hypothetical protein
MTRGGARVLFLWPHTECVECFLPASPVQICMHMADFKRVLAGAVLIIHFKLGIRLLVDVPCYTHGHRLSAGGWTSVDMPNYRLTVPVPKLQRPRPRRPVPFPHLPPPQTRS